MYVKDERKQCPICNRYYLEELLEDEFCKCGHLLVDKNG